MGGAEQQMRAGRKGLLLPQAAQRPCRVGEMTSQDQAKLPPLRGEVVHPDLTIAARGHSVRPAVFIGPFSVLVGGQQRTVLCVRSQVFPAVSDPRPLVRRRPMRLRRDVDHHRAGHVSATQGLGSRPHMLGPVVWGDGLTLPLESHCPPPSDATTKKR